MKIGILTMNTDDGVDPVLLAREAEARGIESIWLPDHTHVPVARKAPYGGPKENFEDSPGDMPRDYYRNYDQLVTLGAIASATNRIRLGTGINLVVQRDPIILAKQLATIDRLSGGRLIFGIGGGAPWNEEELRNHGTEPATRFTLMRERVEAIKAIWTQEEAEYHGKLVEFDPIFSWPKPLQQPHPPILIGGWVKASVDRVIAYGDGWMPGHADDLSGHREMIGRLNEAAAERGQPFTVTIFLAQLDYIERYRELGVERCVFKLPTQPHSSVWSTLDEIARAAEANCGNVLS
ncbi:LLM class F420-dependent oxidoreductase [Sphingobium sp.]|uniref:LLM class F420-dependent oxidoreductase n=1 Tax=Sphingobium sp. TaxID=1912891 RepID=UPI0028BE5F19|nr:LLM class F420-dependent oxidoreductase [Sphingobium sp.]